MAVKGYFYNAHLQESGVYDRLYNDEDFCRFMHNVIGNGVFPTPSTQLAVELTSGMGIKVRAGDSWIEGHKVQNTEDYTLTIDASDPIFSRIDRVVIFTDSSDSVRAGGIRVIKGTPAANPVAPKLTRYSSEEGKYIADPNVFELCLAEITIQPNATALTVADLKDTRPDSDICGWVAGLIQQVETDTLYNQWEAMYRNLYFSMSEWQEDMKTQFDTWFYELSTQLTVGAYIRSFHKVVEGGDMVSNVIPLDMSNYEYDNNDIFIANLNGLMLTKDKDYIFAISGGVPTITLDGNMDAGEIFEITILKSSLAQTSGGLLTRAKGATFIHAEDCMPETTHGFTASNYDGGDIVGVSGRNFFIYDLIPTGTPNGITITKGEESGTHDPIITVDGTAGVTDEEASVNVPELVGAFVVGNTYTISSGKSSGNAYVAVELTCNDSGTTVTETYTSKNLPVTFTVDKTVTAVALKVGCTAQSTADNEVLKPQVEYGDEFTEYEKGILSTFAYYGSDQKPVFTDTINNVWAISSTISDMMVIYVVLGSDQDGDDILYPLNS